MKTSTMAGVEKKERIYLSGKTARQASRCLKRRLKNIGFNQCFDAMDFEVVLDGERLSFIIRAAKEKYMFSGDKQIKAKFTEHDFIVSEILSAQDRLIIKEG